MTDLSELYQQMILDHNKSPRNYRVMTLPSCQAEGLNPLCGDKIHLYVKLNDNVIEEVTFQGEGCAISTASASMMTEALVGKTVGEANQIFDKIHALLTGSGEEAPEGLGKLAVLSGVKQYPMRVKCATLSWHALKNALSNSDEIAQTE